MTNSIHIHPQTTFALYSLPNANNHYLVQQRDKGYSLFTPETFRSKGFAFYPFQETEEHPAVFIKQERRLMNPSIVFQSPHSGTIVESSKAAYLEKVVGFIEATKYGFQKLILSRIKSIDIQAGNLFYLFEALKAAHPSAFVYLVNITGIGCWIGATPERLFSQNGVAQTMALAGTQPDLGLPLGRVVWGQKEIEEQAIVERYFQKILTNNGIAYQKSNRHTVRAGNVLHLCTHFQFPVQDNLYELIDELHPSPAVCGMPKRKAKQFILSNEDHNRAYYCGFLGPVNMQRKTDLFVNLRCMQVLKDRFALYVGGGILPDSDPQKEWLETEMKAKTLSNVIEKVYLAEQFAL